MRIYVQTSKKYEVYFNIFYSECSLYIHRKAKIQKKSEFKGEKKSSCDGLEKQEPKTMQLLSFSILCRAIWGQDFAFRTK